MIGGAYRQAPVFYASPDQLRSLEHQGWSIEAHAISGHGSVDVGHGHRLPYLAAREVERTARSRRLPAFTTRVGRDYRRREDRGREDRRGARDRVLVAVRRVRRRPAARTTTRTASINLASRARSTRSASTTTGRRPTRSPTRSGDPLRISRLRVDPTLTPRAAVRAHRARHRRLRDDRAARCVGSSSRSWPRSPRSAAAPRSRSRRTRAPARSRASRARHGRLQVIAFTEARPTSAARGLALGAPRLARRRSRPRGSRSGPEGTIAYRDADAFSRGLAAAAPTCCPCCAIPSAASARARRTRSLRKRTALRLARDAARARRTGPRARPRAACLPPIARAAGVRARPARRAAARARASWSSCRRSPTRASAARAAGYDLRDLSRPATLVLRAWAPDARIRRARIRSRRSPGTSRRCATRSRTPRARA